MHSVTHEGKWNQTTDKIIRVGVAGGRFGAAFHWHEHPNSKVEAVADCIPERRNQLMSKYHCEKAYESIESLTEDDAVDAVAVFTPPPLHAKHAILCMERGKHVIGACPSCLTLEEANQLKDAKEKTGMKYMSAETSYYRWETVFVRELYASGRLGQLLYTEAEYYHPGIAASSHSLSWDGGNRTWRYGYPPMLYATHATAFYVGVCGGRLQKVSCIGLRDDQEPAFVENQYGSPFRNGMALFLTADGKPFRCNVGWRLCADDERAQWFADKGTIYMADCAGRQFTACLDDNMEHKLPDYWERVPEKMRYDSGHGKSHPFLTNEFVMACVEDREPSINLYESLAFCVPGIVAHQSCFSNGEQLEIPLFDNA